jgi:penicillin-binding protein 1A
MSWTAALKEYAKITGKFGVPKKGTPEYAAVVKIQNKLKGIPDPEEVKAEKIKKERKKKEEAMPKPPTEEEIKKKAEEDKIKQIEADKKAIEDAIAAKAAKKAAKIALKDKLKKEKEELAKQAEEQAKNRAKLDAKLGSEAATMKKLGKGKRAMEDIKAEEEASKNVIKARYGGRTTAVEDKTPKKQREPSFRIEDKQIIISFRE